MEFRRSVFNSTMYNSYQQGNSSSGLTYFAQQARRVGYPQANVAQAGDYFHRPSDVPESVLREIEKQRIREQFIASEVERRRQLEDEVRMEIMLEREVAMRGARSHDLPEFSRPQPPLVINSRLPALEHSPRRFDNELPFSLPSKVRITEVEAEAEAEITPEVKRNKIIFLPKPQENIRIKRKAMVSPDVSSVLSLVDQKKAKNPLACEICNISATSQRALSEHFQGKKHKSKEARQSSQIAGKNFAIGFFSRKSNAPDITKEDVREEKPEDHVAIEVSENSEKLKNDEVEMNKKVEKDLKFSHWCELCKLGTFSRKVMSSHMRGKKHTARVLQSKKAQAGVASRSVTETAAAEKVTEAKQDIAGGSNDEEVMEKDVVVGGGSNQAVGLIGWYDTVY